MSTKKVALLILDGWGIGNGTASDAIAAANTPVMDDLYKNKPHSTLKTSGLEVGLPEGQMGNSEVGHLNIGAGRVIFQELVKINLAISEHTLDSNSTLLETFEYCKKNHKALHLMGLLSDGCIHSSEQHLFRLIELAHENGIEEFYIHAFTDGRDTDPKSGLSFIKLLQGHLANTKGKLASVVGRYYAMDRDKRWERVKVAYDLLVHGNGEKSDDVISTIQNRYVIGETDEFIQPVSLEEKGKLKEGDAVISFNYRTDRCREITEVLTQVDMKENGMRTIPLHYVTMTTYDESYQNINVIFHKDDLTDTLGEIVSKAGKTQLRIAETEKYPHVTFFFSGGNEHPFQGERRIMIPSPKVATYDLQPEMSAIGITDAVIKDIEDNSPDFICLNFANADMVGHTGVFSAIVKAVETVDTCLGSVLDALRKKNYSAIIIADHGNADFAINADGTPNTAHTTNPVPCILVDDTYNKINGGKLADLAPTILTLMGIKIPPIMNGSALI